MKKNIIFGIAISLLMLTGCSNTITEKGISKSDTPQEVIAKSKIDPKANLKEKKIDFDKKDFENFKKENNSQHITRDYVARMLLDIKYPMSNKDILKELKAEQPDWDEFLKNEGLKEDDLVNDLKYSKQITQLAKENMAVPDSELEDYYASLPTTLNISHILVKDENMANQLYDDLSKGADSSALAKENSLDENTANEGGKWLNYEPGKSLEIIDEQINSMKKEGDISKPFKSILGWHIIKVDSFNKKESFNREKALDLYFNNTFTYDSVNELLDLMISDNLELLPKDIQKELTKENDK